MKKCILTLAAVLCIIQIIGCGNQQTTEFAVETLAMTVGYELRNDFEWTQSADSYFNAIMQGKVSLDAAQAAESYLRTITHPLIANRLVGLAGMVGFNLDEYGQVISVDKVNIRLLQTAAQGFRMGLLLDGPVSVIYDNPSDRILSIPSAR